MSAESQAIEEQTRLATGSKKAPVEVDTSNGFDSSTAGGEGYMIHAIQELTTVVVGYGKNSASSGAAGNLGGTIAKGDKVFIPGLKTLTIGAGYALVYIS